MKYYDSIITHFTFHGKLFDRPEQLRLPHLDNGKVIATNGHIMIIIPTTMLKKQYISIEHYPNYESVMPAQKTYFENPKPILYEELKEVIQKILKYKICEYCEGEGKLFTKKGHERDDCIECTGEGIIPHDEGDRYSDKDRVKIGEAYFQPRYIKTLLKTMEVNKTKELFHLAGREKTQNLFQFNGINIILMPTNQSTTENTVKFNSHEVSYNDK